ncbi:MAG: FkbM family methyltransferase [Elainellaceae cyanobacterium]
MESDNSYSQNYQNYIQTILNQAASGVNESIQDVLEATNWDEPQSWLDCNNLAVIALVMAEQSDESQMRTLYLEMALEALNEGAAAHPLCAAHLALVHCMIGQSQEAMRLAFSKFVETSQVAFTAKSDTIGLVYLPMDKHNRAIARRELLQIMLQADTGYTQAILLLGDVLRRSQLVFYNAGGLRFLQLTNHLIPNSAWLNLSLGLASLFSNQWEGLAYLYRAHAIAPNYAPAVQALYLTYRALNQQNLADGWLKAAQAYYREQPESLEWQWANLLSDQLFTYVPFDHNVLLAVEANFRSIVTSVMLVEGDWFEAEMEFWREQLQPGMTVIDVGANVGVYTFSAAQQVGKTGRVLAVEPFSGCVQCMEETRRVNDLSQVTICAGAASDCDSTIRISLHRASELNEVITDDSAPASGNVEEVPCYTLDTLVEQEKLDQVDWLKIDAEGHEMQVLKGSDRLLNHHKPGILYENIAAAKGSNTEVAAYLQSKGYQLFCYQPFVRQLMPISTDKELTGNLNIIALPAEKV